jgi:hypothetical protein
MARQHTSTRNLKSIAVALLVGVGLAILFKNLDGPTAHLTNLFGTGAREAVELLPYFIPAVWQALRTYAFDHQRFSPCVLQMLVSFWPLIRVVAGAA